MADHLTRAGRSRVMAAIRSKDTGPERALRAALRARGATGYRLHRRDLPGRPDVAFPRWKIAVFADGAFWHGHPEHFDAARATDYWREKIRRTQERDAAADAELAEDGWGVVRIWDFEILAAPDEAAVVVTDALRQRGWPETP